MRLYKIAFYALLLTGFAAYAAPMGGGADTVSDYLMISTEQQEISLSRYLDANKDIANQCMPNWSLDKSNEYFLSWVNDNPQYLRRGLTTAFSGALLAACKEKK